MKGLLEEIAEVPERAALCYERNRGLKLPRDVPYLGMGASYNAALTLLYAGANIGPFMASEYYSYAGERQAPLGVLISQSGETSEVLWSLERFKKAVAVTNHADSALATAEKTKEVVELYAGPEGFSSTKTYFNTLVALYAGLGIDPKRGIERVKASMPELQQEAEEQARRVGDYAKGKEIAGRYVLGSGPNYATARQGALVLSETTRLAWNGMAVAEYDHGPKETAENSIVVMLESEGKSQQRLEGLKQVLRAKSNAFVVEMRESVLPEYLSPFPLVVMLDFFMYSVAEAMNVEDHTFRIGEKVTIVSHEAKPKP